MTHHPGYKEENMREMISAVYQIKNKVTGERYVGSSKDVYARWANHKCTSVWNSNPNRRLYQDFQKYGIENFMFAILSPVQPKYLKQVEQEFIDLLQPAYNSNRANGWDVERYKATHKAYEQTEEYKESRKTYRQTEEYKESRKAYIQTEEYKESRKAYANRLCNYKGETLTLNALGNRFRKAGITHPTLEAKKYLIQE